MPQAPGPVLITGASSGLGRSLSVFFARRGHRVFAAARRTAQLDALAAECKEFGGEIVPVSMDVSNTSATVKRIQALDDECEGLDYVIANAGMGERRRRTEVDWESIEAILQVNVMGAAATLSAVASRMAARKRGHLAGVSSLAGYRGLPSGAAYSGSKAFLATFLEGLRVDLAPVGVRVTILSPGFVKSEMTADNPVKMPFLLETDDAAERMGKAVLRGDAHFAFPWQMAVPVSMIRLLPPAVYDRAARRLLRR